MSFEGLCRLGEPPKGDPARSTASLSDAAKLAFARRLDLIDRCDRQFKENPKLAKKAVFQQVSIEEARDRTLASGGGSSALPKTSLAWRTIGSVWRTFVESGEDTNSVKPRLEDRGRARSREKDPVTEVIRNVLKTEWVSGNLTTIDAVTKHIGNIIISSIDGPLLGKKTPSDRTIYREINRDEDFKRHLDKVNLRTRKALVKLHDQVERPLDELQADEVFLDEELMEFATGKSQKGSVLFCVDACTGVPVGLNLGAGAADSQRACLLMLHCIERKPPIELKNGVVLPWAAYGYPRSVKFDLGKIFKAQDFVLPLTDFNIRVINTPGYCPWLKGVIERFNGVVRRWLRVKRRPSTQSDNQRQYGGDAKPNKHLISLEDLQRLLELTIAKKLLLARRGRGEAPMDRFAKLSQRFPPRMPDAAHELLTLGIRDTADLSREGIAHLDAHFRARHPDKVLDDSRNWGPYEIRIHPRHLDYILLLHPNGHWVRFDRADRPDAAGLSPAQWDVRRPQLAAQARSNPGRDEQLLVIEQEMARLTRLKRTPPAAPPPPVQLLPDLAEDTNDDFDPLEMEIPCSF